MDRVDKTLTVDRFDKTLKTLWKGPNPKKIREVMNKIKDSEHYDQIKIDFNFESVERDIHDCQTVACHGGVLALVLQDSFLDEEPSSGIRYDYIFRGEDGSYIDYRDGVALFNNFIYEYELPPELLTVNFAVAQWAEINPKIWGNKQGGYMFTIQGHRAFGFNDERDCSIEAIVNHWERVADRKEAWDKANNITY